jgi:tetratricopeptide (TPR) repeat protein
VKRSLTFAGLTLCALLGGCASPPADRSDARIGSLNRHALPDVPALDGRDSRKAAMREYEAFLSDSSENILVPEAMRRLADLNLADEQQKLADGKFLPGRQQSRAAELYKELLTRFPDNGRNDNALYQLARAYEQSGEPEPSMGALSNYAGRYRQSDLIDEVEFRRAEYLFAKRDYAGAELAYDAVIAQGAGSSFHQQALYKLGWSRFKLGEYENALDAFTTLLDETIAGHRSGDMPKALARGDQERLEDTLRAVSLCFSYLGDSTAVARYFGRRGPRSYEPLIYANLAGLHLSKERFTDAADTFRRFAIVHAKHPEAPLFQSRVIDVFKKAGFNERVLEEKQAFVERYQPGAAYWTKNDPGNAPEVLTQVHRHLRDIAGHYHAQAQEKKTPAAYDTAGYWYKLYLRAFPDRKETPYLNFLYAELLTSAGRHGAAVDQYERTAYGYPAHDKAADAGYAAVLAFEKHEPTLKGKARRQWHRRGIASALRFSEAFPTHPQALAVRTRSAQQLYALKEYEQAASAAEPVTRAASADAALQLSAWTVIAHAEFDLGDFHKAEAAYQQVLARTASGDKRRPELRDKLAASIYKQGEQARSQGAPAEAAAHFLRVAKTVPESSIAATARYDAAASYITLKQLPDAIRILEAWRRDYPDHSLNREATRTLAVLYKDNGQGLQAAGEFERIAAFERDPEIRREAAWTAAELYTETRKTDKAIPAYENFITAFPRPVGQAIEARAQLVDLYGEAGNRAKQNFWRREIVKADAGAGGERSDRTRFLAAHAQLDLTSPDFQAYRGVTLREPLQRNLALKKRFMEKAIDGFTAAATYQVAPVTTQATYRIAEIYANFAKALMDSERPGNLSADELEQYNLLLEEQAYPFEEKSIEVHETNLRYIARGQYDEWVRKSLAQLADIMPARYAKTERSEIFVSTR